MTRLAAAAIILSLCAAPAHAAPLTDAPLTDAQVRAFVARQEKSWNAGDLDAYFAGFRRDAVFTDQYRTPAGQLVPYGSSTLAQARVQTRKFRATSKVAETNQILRIALTPDARAQVLARVTSIIQGPQGRRTTCAERRQELVMAAGRLRSRGRTDTFMRCAR